MRHVYSTAQEKAVHFAIKIQSPLYQTNVIKIHNSLPLLFSNDS